MEWPRWGQVRARRVFDRTEDLPGVWEIARVWRSVEACLVTVGWDRTVRLAPGHRLRDEGCDAVSRGTEADDYGSDRVS